MVEKSIALAYGYWSQNIGNAFFQLGAQALLKEACGVAPKMIADIPAHWTLNRKSRGNPKNSWDHLSSLEADIFVFEGPELTENVETMWDPVLPRLRARGIESVMLSVSFSKYSKSEIEAAKRLIAKHKITKIATRDPVTAERLESECQVVSGICSAWFLPWAYQPLHITESFIAICLEVWPESDELIDLVVAGDTVNADDFMRPNGLRRQSFAYAYHVLRSSKRRQEAAGMRIVRPVHRTNPAVPGRLYKDVNSLASDEPFTYLSTYASAQLTITDRVHAAVASLAYGTPAFLLSASKRANLFSAVGVDVPMKALTSVDSQMLEARRRSHAVAVRKLLGGPNEADRG